MNKCIPDCKRVNYCSNQHKGGCPDGRDWEPVSQKNRIELFRHGWWYRKKSKEDVKK